MSDDKKWTIGESWLVVAVVILLSWATLFAAAVAFLRGIVGTHASWAWAIAPLGLAGALVLVYLFYRAIFAPPYNPQLHELTHGYKTINESREEESDDAPAH